MESFEAEKFRRAAARLYHHSTRALRLASISSPLMELIAAIGGAAVLVYGALQIRQDAFSAGQFFKFLAAAFASYSPIRRLGAANAVAPPQEIVVPPPPTTVPRPVPLPPRCRCRPSSTG